ncbi:DUF5666 domain-containing protein [Roseateles sp. BYS180W]|uniref:DUF5666 domain-containing protein n=1 Tax=Roseateles rivi TaxID=3299028 RepID=A0ABW7FY69_9BURK
MKHFAATLALCSALLTAALLSACGGGGSTAAPAQPSPATPEPAAITALEGTVTGFGSVVIDGVRYDDSRTTVGFAHKADALTAASLGELRTGMRVSASLGSDGLLNALTVNFAMVGTVDAVNATQGNLRVFGQAINVVSSGQLPTQYEGFTGLNQLVVGDLVRVAGTVAADGSVTATRIERRAKDGTEVFRLSGMVRDVDGSAKTFGLVGNSSVVVDYAKASLLPAGASIANGTRVSVIALSSPSTSGGRTVLQASQVDVHKGKPTEGASLAAGGVISQFLSLSAFYIGDVAVDASKAALTDGTTAADIANGAQAVASGTVVNGVLVANKLKVFKQDTAIKALLIGQISDFVSLSQFSVRGTTVDGSQARFVRGQASDLALGTWVQISGAITANGVQAKDITVTTPPADKPARLAGALSAVNAAARQFTLLGVPVQWGESTRFLPSGKSAADLSVGAMLVVEGSYSASSATLLASSITVASPLPTERTVGLSGVISEVGTNSFKLGSYTVALSSTTRVEGPSNSLADLVSGKRVEVKASASLVNGQVSLTALKIEVEDGKNTQGMSYASGLIADFASPAQFTVNGQRVDASAASVVVKDGTLSQLANGVKVSIKGQMSNGVLVAAVIHIQPG